MIALEKRLTHKYVGTYQHEDKWQFIANADEIGRRELPRTEEEEEDPCEPVNVEVFLLVTRVDDELLTQAPADPDEAKSWLDGEIRRAIRDTHTRSGCAHEYDCCGCRSHYAEDIERVTGDLWKVRVHSSRNY